MTLGRHGGEVERAEPDSEHHCSPVLRPYAVTTGDSERRRGGAQRRPPPPLGLSKAHIPARQRKGSVTCYRGASLIQVRLRGDVAAGNTSGCGPRGEIVEFSPRLRVGGCSNCWRKWNRRRCLSPSLSPTRTTSRCTGRITKAIWRRSVTGCNVVGRKRRLFGSWNSKSDNRARTRERSRRITTCLFSACPGGFGSKRSVGNPRVCAGCVFTRAGNTGKRRLN